MSFNDFLRSSESMKKAPCVELNLIFRLRCKNVYRSACLSGYERRQLSKFLIFFLFSPHCGCLQMYPNNSRSSVPAALHKCYVTSAPATFKDLTTTASISTSCGKFHREPKRQISSSARLTFSQKRCRHLLDWTRPQSWATWRKFPFQQGRLINTNQSITLSDN